MNQHNYMSCESSQIIVLPSQNDNTHAIRHYCLQEPVSTGFVQQRLRCAPKLGTTGMPLAENMLFILLATARLVS